MDNTTVSCTICGQLLHNETPIRTVQAKGLANLINNSKIRLDDKWKLWDGKVSYDFHENCVKSYSRLRSSDIPRKKPKLEKPRELNLPPSSSSSTIQVPVTIPVPVSSSGINSTKSSSLNFDYKNLCIFCGKNWDKHHKIGHVIKNSYFSHRILEIADRDYDDTTFLLKERLRATDLVAVEARYHKKCYDSFMNPPLKEPRTSSNIHEDATFQEVCDHIEKSNNFRFKLSDLRKIMGDNLINPDKLFKKLQQKYGSEIMVTRSQGKEPVVYYKSFNIAGVCSDWFCANDNFDELQKRTILTVASEILKAEIKDFRYEKDRYPASSSFLNGVIQDIPPLLTYFLGDLLSTDNDKENCIKRDNIAHSIVSILRPNSFISTLQLALGTYIYRKTGSRLVIDVLSKLGISASYHSIQLHEASTIKDPPEFRITEETFVQFVYDNTDHNTSTLDGKRTFHCLGGIACYTPESGISYEGGSKKLKKMPTASELASEKTIPIIPYGAFNSTALDTVVFVNVNKLQLGSRPQLSQSYATYLWAKKFKIPNLPSWRGFMEVVCCDSEYFVSSILCLPFINEPPSKLTTLNTALHYSREECNRRNQKTCFVTFDQPLYWKSRSIVANSTTLPNVVVRLGGFHMIMSYLGSIGYIMDRSGLEDLWGVVYAGESVKKMMSGHAYSRAIRAHILTFTALGITICNTISLDKGFEQFLINFFKDWDTNPPFMSHHNSDRTINDMMNKFIEKLNVLATIGPTAKLWIQYMKSVIIALQFIEAERLGDWKLHLQAVRDMLPYFHASGHFAYAKSAQVYLQDMVQLESQMDDEEYYKFTSEGFFTIRRTDKAWSGIWSDMTIEQTLNRFFGTDLKHGRGVTPSVVTRYLLAMPTAFNIMNCLEEYCNLSSYTSEQHIDLCKSRMNQDNEDIDRFVFWFNEHAPFKDRSSLVSLSTGIVGGDNIDCHLAVEKGLKGMASMEDKNGDNISLSNVNKVKNLGAAKNKVHIGDEEYVAVDASLLFQRISIVIRGNTDLTRTALRYELSPCPLSLFDKHGFMRKTPKSELYKVFKSINIQNPVEFINHHIPVIDGGWLLHQVSWPHGYKYVQIFDIYLRYIKSHFGTNAFIVFDGYDKDNIGVKSYERFRRKEKNMAADLDFTPEMLNPLTKAKFLSNIANKKKFVDFLTSFLNSNNINVQIAREDADILIVKTAIQIKERTNNQVIVIGNDTDLFVIMIALTPEYSNLDFCKVSSGKKPYTFYSTSAHIKMKSFILFAHAFGGCDTTSAIFRKGKKSILNLLQKEEALQDACQYFYYAHSTTDTIYGAAEQFIFSLYKQNKSTKAASIDQLRYDLFTSTVAHAKKELSLAVLPPTPSSLRQHAYRVFYQIQEWLGNELNPEEWGWKKTTTMMLPITNTDDPAPKDLLNLVIKIYKKK